MALLRGGQAIRVLRCVVATLLICCAVFPPPAPAQDSRARVDYAGRRILFDSGCDLDDFTSNVKALGVDLTRLDFVVLTHRHGDHTSGLHYVLTVNLGVQIYTPSEAANFDTPVSPALGNLIS